MQNQASDFPSFKSSIPFKQHKNVYTPEMGKTQIYGTQVLSKNFQFGLKILKPVVRLQIRLAGIGRRVHFSMNGYVMSHFTDSDNENLKSVQGDKILVKGKDGNIKVFKNQKLVYDEDYFLDLPDDWTFIPRVVMFPNDQVQILQYS